MWTPDALASEAGPYSATVWRMVEAQARAATMRLVDTLQEQSDLEDALEDSKPPFPEDVRDYSYLLATPFRYSPYPHGSRFRRANQPDGAFYASEKVETAVAEQAFYCLLFFSESAAAPALRRAVEYTVFAVPCLTERHIDLTNEPFVRDEGTWLHPTDYGPCQSLADAAREAAVEVIRYQSVRDPRRGHNVAILRPSAFARKAPVALQTWHIFTRREAVQARCENPPQAVEFMRDVFSRDHRLEVTGA